MRARSFCLLVIIVLGLAMGVSGCGTTVALKPEAGSTQAGMVGWWKTDLIPPEPADQAVSDGTVYEMHLQYAIDTEKPEEGNFMHGSFTSTLQLKTETRLAAAVLESLVEGLETHTSFKTTIPKLKISGLKATNAEPNPWGWPGAGMTVERDEQDPDVLYFTLVTPQNGVVLNRVRFHRR